MNGLTMARPAQKKLIQLEEHVFFFQSSDIFLRLAKTNA